jgi:hypothetical protein
MAGNRWRGLPKCSAARPGGGSGPAALAGLLLAARVPSGSRLCG